MTTGLDRSQPSRFSITRRTAVDLAPPAASMAGAGQLDLGGGAADSADTELELNSPLDIPAFLRRQEG
jgi:hypothetical protein